MQSIIVFLAFVMYLDQLSGSQSTLSSNGFAAAAVFAKRASILDLHWLDTNMNPKES